MLALLLGAGCTSTSSSISSSSPSGAAVPSQDTRSAGTSSINVGGVTVTADAGAGPGPACLPAQVATRVQALLTAFNSGDQPAFSAFFDRSLSFSEPNPLPPTYFNDYLGPQGLADYLVARHAKHESRRLVSLQVSYGGQGDRDRVDFGYNIQRTADDTNDLAPGKGLMSCANGMISVWQMGSSRP